MRQLFGLGVLSLALAPIAVLLWLVAVHGMRTVGLPAATQAALVLLGLADVLAIAVAVWLLRSPRIQD